MTLELPNNDDSATSDRRLDRAAAPGPSIRQQIGMAGPVYLNGFFGTVLAGALFPTVLTIIRLTLRVQPEQFLRLDFYLFAGVGAAYGIVLAGIAAAAVFPIAAVIQFLTGLHSARAAIVSIAGGWSGVVATLAMSPIPDRRFAILTAMLMGQVLAGIAARNVQRQQDYVCFWAAAPRPGRFGRRQVVGLAATIAVLTAVIASLRLPEATFRDLGYAVGFQVLMMVTYFGVSAVRARAVGQG